jgi:disease resistance protein RPM1
MKGLNYHFSKRLFLKRIFGYEECYIQLQEVSDEILKKCGGLPLAIISISGLLANKPAMKEEWEKVRNSIAFSLERHRNLEGIKAILTLSYNDLPRLVCYI